MASTIAAITTGTGGVVTTADSSGDLSLLSGATTVVAVTSTGATVTGSLNAPNTFGFKNRIINGGMVIDQRNAGASVTITNTSATTYTLDRWAVYGTQASKFSVQQDAAAVTPPVGFNDYLGVTSLSAYSIGSGDLYIIGQKIEGYNIADFAWGTANAKTITLSFWVRSSLTGTFGGTLSNNAFDRSYPFTYTISAANTWEQKTLTIAGDTTGTWLTTNGTGLTLWLGLGCGSSVSGTAGSWQAAGYYSATGAVSVVGTSGATFYVTGVQLEKGSTATSFDFRDYGRELIMCQRYCFVQSAAGGGTNYGISSANSIYPLGIVSFPVQMRITPSVTLTAANTFSFGSGSPTTVVLDSASPTSGVIYGTGGTSGTAGYSGRFMSYTASSLIWSAEL